MQTIKYDDKIVRYFLLATTLWGVVGMLVGLLIATQLAFCLHCDFFISTLLNICFIRNILEASKTFLRVWETIILK